MPLCAKVTRHLLRASMGRSSGVKCAFFFLCALIFHGTVDAQETTWDGGGTGGNWSLGNNWNPTGAPTNGAFLSFAGSTRLVNANNIVNGTLSTISGITFSNAAGAFTITGNDLTNGAGGIQVFSIGSAQTWSIDLTLGANQIWNVASNDFNMRGTLELGGRTLTIIGNNDMWLSNNITGAAADGNIIKSSTGALVLSGNSTFVGTITNNAGLIVVAANNALGATNGGTVVATGATLGFSNNVVYTGAETLLINSTGFNNQGAINNILGNNSFAGSISNATASTIGSTAGTLTLGGNIQNGGLLLSFTNSAGAQIVSTGIISGAGGLNKTGPGTLVLEGNNTYAGATTNFGGVLIVSGDNALGTTAGNTVITAGSTLSFSNNVVYTGTETLLINSTGFNNQGAINNIDGNNSFAGSISNVTASTIGSTAGTLTLGGNIQNGGLLLSFTNSAGAQIVSTGIISGAGGLNKTGPGTLVLEGNNTYAGATTNFGGVLIVSGDNALGTTAGNTVITAGSTLSFSNNVVYTGTETLLINSTGFNNQGAINNIQGNNSFAGSISNVTASTIGSTAGTLTLGGNIQNGGLLLSFTNSAGAQIVSTGIISGAGGLNKTGRGTLVLEGNNTYAGPTTNFGGVLIISGDNALGTTAGNTVITAGSTLGFSNNVVYTGAETLLINSTGFNNQGAINNIAGNNSFAGSISNVTASTILSSSGSLTIGGAIQNGGLRLSFSNSANALTVSSGTISGAGGLHNTGPGTLVLAGNNTYTGATTNTAGVLIVAGDNALGTTAGNTVIAAGATLGFSNNVIYTGTETVLINSTGFNNQGAINNIDGNNSFAGSISNATASTILSSAGTLTIGGAIQNGGLRLSFSNSANAQTVSSGVISGAGGLNKTGPGTLVLSGNNTYAGATTNTAGIMIVATNNALGGTAGNTVVTSGATLGFSNNITYSSAEILVISGTGVGGQGAINNIHGNNSFGGTISNAAASTINVDAGSLVINNSIFNGGNLLTVTNAAGTTLIFSNAVSGAGGLTKNGDGTLTLAAANTYAGTTILNAGTLRSGAAGALGSGTFILNGGLLVITNVDQAYGQTFSNAVASTIEVASGRTLTIGNGLGDLTGAALLTKTGTGTLMLTNANNTFTGGISIDVGIVTVSNINSLGVGTVTLNGGELRHLGTTTFSNALNVTANSLLTSFNGDDSVFTNNSFSGVSGTTLTVSNLSGAASQHALALSGTGFNFAANIILDAGSLIQMNNTVGTNELSGNISGSGAAAGFIRSGAGGVTILSGTNSFSSDVNVTGGILILKNDLALGTASGKTVVSSGAALLLENNINIGSEALNIAGTGVAGSGAIGSSGNNTLGGPINVTAAGTIATTSGQLTLSGAITNNGSFGLTFTNNAGTTALVSGTITGTGGIIHNGAGTLTLASINSFTGVTTNNGGTIRSEASGSMGTGNIVLNAGTLVVTNVNQTFNQILTIGGPATIDVGGSSVTNIISAVNGLTGAGSLTKAGAGVLSLTAANNYSGSNVVSGGVLELKAAGAMGSVGSITLNSGGTLLLTASETIADTGRIYLNGGTLTSSSATETLMGALTLSASSTINLGVGGALGGLTFDIGSDTSGGTAILTINGWAGGVLSPGTDDRIYFVNDPGQAFLDQVQFTGYTQGAWWNSTTKEITPIPEPATLLSAALLLGILWRRGRASCRSRDS